MEIDGRDALLMERQQGIRATWTMYGERPIFTREGRRRRRWNILSEAWGVHGLDSTFESKKFTADDIERLCKVTSMSPGDLERAWVTRFGDAIDDWQPAGAVSGKAKLLNMAAKLLMDSEPRSDLATLADTWETRQSSGFDDNPLSPAEMAALEFLRRHPKLLEAIADMQRASDKGKSSVFARAESGVVQVRTGRIDGLGRLDPEEL